MTRLAILLSLTALTACTPKELTAPDLGLDDGATARSMSVAETLGTLALLNSADTDIALLDSFLDVRAARSLVHHRNGPDGVFGTADDDLYDSIAEADAQYYVGNNALHKLATFAADSGWIPSGSDVVGSWDDVEFTLDQMTGALDLANTLTFTYLDDDLGLDRRAATSIVEARPIADMDELSGLYYVSKTALTKLRGEVVIGNGPWGECDTSADCADGLVCMGEIAWNSGIYCVDDSMYGNFTHDEADEIPDQGSLVTAVNVQGLGSVPIDVVLTLDVDHPRPSDLKITMEHIGYEQVVWDHETSPSNEIIIRAVPSDDMVQGDWTLTVEDSVAGETGELHGWNLYIVSNWD